MASPGWLVCREAGWLHFTQWGRWVKCISSATSTNSPFASTGEESRHVGKEKHRLANSWFSEGLTYRDITAWLRPLD